MIQDRSTQEDLKDKITQQHIKELELKNKKKARQVNYGSYVSGTINAGKKLYKAVEKM